ncbi:hypothetical protein [Streptomyces sp. NBC_01518]|uniref:hypothetical protein n=1 Tax=Streptomyces sp. NBC_01518 TaxID=2903891 RepID=UPI003867611C
MKRIEAAQLSGAPYVAQLNISLEAAAARWGAAEITWDDMGPWLTYAFELSNGARAAVVREVENAPTDGFILTMDAPETSEEALTRFLIEAELPREQVTHISGH